MAVCIIGYMPCKRDALRDDSNKGFLIDLALMGLSIQSFDWKSDALTYSVWYVPPKDISIDHLPVVMTSGCSHGL